MLNNGVPLFIYKLFRKKLINCFAQHFSSLKIFLLKFCIPEKWTVYYKHSVQQNSKRENVKPKVSQVNYLSLLKRTTTVIQF